MDKYFLEQGELDPQERLKAGMMYLGKCLSLPKNGDDDVTQLVEAHPTLGPISVEVTRKAKSNPAYQIAEEATLGRLDTIKQQGFYVDVTGSEVKSPRIFTEQDAKNYVEAAEIVIGLIAPADKFGSEPVQMQHIAIRFGT